MFLGGRKFRPARAVSAATCALLTGLASVAPAWGNEPRRTDPSPTPPLLPTVHEERPVPPPAPRTWPVSGRVATPATVWVRGDFRSIQVNVDAQGQNIVGDAANEPSIAVDPNNPNRIAIGWRQFDNVASSFRQSGVAYSDDGGQTWHSPSPNVLEPNVFSSDPILESDAEGRFFYLGLQPDRGPGDWACYMYRSEDGGVTWPNEHYAFGGDKAWYAIDKTGGPGHGNIYMSWNPNATCCNGIFNRSTDGGISFSLPIPLPSNAWAGTLTVDPDGVLYIAGATNSGVAHVIRSSDAANVFSNPTFDLDVIVDLGGTPTLGGGVNPVGLLGQVWIDTDHSSGSRRGYVYVLASVDPPGLDPLDVMFIRSTDGGLNWSTPVRVNDDPTDNGAWQWFGTMSVAPNGRIDAIWNDTRADPSATFSELYYSFSVDGGMTWSQNVPLSPAFNHFLGYPQQDKLGDYYDMESDDAGASIAYAATFNGEQDVYYLRIGEVDCNNNGVPDLTDIAQGTSDDCNTNGIPDECDTDCDGNGLVDDCEAAAGQIDDCNHNLIPDVCDPDFDRDTIPDDCDDDIDNDGVRNVFDDCPFTPLGLPVTNDGRPIGDSSGNCVVDLADYSRMNSSRCLRNGGPNVFQGRTCTLFFDFDGDFDIDMEDFAGFQRSFGRQ